MSYFANFPTIDYPNAGLAKNIVARVKLQAGLGQNKADGLIDFQMPAGIRPDVLAHQYYGQATYDWLFYLANDIIDPYTQVYLTDNQLNDIIADKYGSLEIAQQKIAYWVNNWDGDDSIIDPILYNAFPPEIKQMYNYMLDYNQQINGYVRKQMDVRKHTNMFVSYTITTPIVGNPGDLVHLFSNTYQVGKGQIVSITGTNVVIEHVIGTYVADVIIVVANNSSSAIYALDYSHDCISLVEAPYYEPVTLYDEAVRRNELRKHVKLISNDQSDAVARDLKRVLNG